MFKVNVTYEIKIENIKFLPEELLTTPDFIEWLQHKAIEHGSGEHSEYYCDENCDLYIDVEVQFYVRTLKIITNIM